MKLDIADDEQLDYVIGPKDIRSTTWYLNWMRFRTWDHTKIEGRELKTKKRVKAWAGWAPVSVSEKAKFQELVLRPRCDHDASVPCGIEGGDGLVLLHDRLVAAAAEIKTTRHRQETEAKFRVPQEIRLMTSDAAKCWDPQKRRHLCKIATKARREFEAGQAVLPRGKVVNRLVITKLWVNGRASGDSDERTGEAHCERCYDDKAETTQVQAKRILRRRTCGDRQEALQRHRIMITVDGVLRARGKMLRNKANGPADCVW